MHAESQLTMELIQSQAWDVVVLQEQSRKPAYPAQTVCEDSIRHLASLVVAIKANNPDTILQVSTSCRAHFHHFPVSVLSHMGETIWLFRGLSNLSRVLRLSLYAGDDRILRNISCTLQASIS